MVFNATFKKYFTYTVHRSIISEFDHYKVLFCLWYTTYTF
jgi:hypothetical protein